MSNQQVNARTSQYSSNGRISSSQQVQGIPQQRISTNNNGFRTSEQTRYGEQRIISEEKMPTRLIEESHIGEKVIDVKERHPYEVMRRVVENRKKKRAWRSGHY